MTHHTRVLRTISVDATQVILIPGTIYSTSNDYNTDSNTISRNQLKQKFKLMIKTSEYVIYSNRNKLKGVLIKYMSLM